MRKTVVIPANKVSEFENRLKGYGEKYFLFYLIGKNTLLKIKEIINLKTIDVYDYNFNKVRDYIVIPTDKIIRKTRINSELKMMIETYIIQKELNNKNYLFHVKQKDKAMSRFRLHQVFKECSRDVGITESVGILGAIRKTPLLNLYNKCGDINYISQLLNHKSIKRTQNYMNIESR